MTRPAEASPIRGHTTLIEQTAREWDAGFTEATNRAVTPDWQPSGLLFACCCAAAFIVGWIAASLGVQLP